MSLTPHALRAAGAPADRDRTASARAHCCTNAASAAGSRCMKAARTSSPTSKCAAPDGRAQPGEQWHVRAPCAARMRCDRGFEHARRQSAPACMGRAHRRTIPGGEQHRQAVGGRMAHTTPGRAVIAASATGSVPARHRHPDPPRRCHAPGCSQRGAAGSELGSSPAGIACRGHLRRRAARQRAHAGAAPAIQAR